MRSALSDTGDCEDAHRLGRGFNLRRRVCPPHGGGGRGGNHTTRSNPRPTLLRRDNGRGALGNPWIFSEIKARLEGCEYTPPTPRERIDTALGELRMCVFEKGEYIGVRESRKRLAWYLKGLRGAAAARDEINRAESVDSIADILNRLAESATE